MIQKWFSLLETLNTSLFYTTFLHDFRLDAKYYKVILTHDMSTWICLMFKLRHYIYLKGCHGELTDNSESRKSTKQTA